jgi:hypothetical protein
MKDSLTHDQLEQLLPAAALEILEGDELHDLTVHVRDCADCERLLESYREVLGGWATGLPGRAFEPARSARVRARLLARIGSGASAPEVGLRSRRSPGWVDRWAGWAVAAAMAGVLLVHHSVHRPVAYGWLVAGALALVLLALGIYVRIQRARVRALEERLRSLADREDRTERPLH